MDLQALKLPRMCLKLCGISGDCRSRPVNMGDEPVNELRSLLPSPVSDLNSEVPLYYDEDGSYNHNSYRVLRRGCQR